MSAANAEDSDGSVRVTRRSMRRMGSVESVNEAVDTPTLPPRSKQLKTISELAGTPKTSLLASPRRTRKNSEEPVAVGSPFRRTTRASSQDKDVTASPLPIRASRRSAVAESDTDDAASTPAKSKADRNKRKSTIASPKIAQIVEEPEDDNEKELLEEDEKTKELDSSNDLELRTRSITKSPSVSPPKPSLNGSSKSNGHLDSSIEEPEVMKVFKSRNIHEAKTSVTEISFHDSDTEALPAKTYSKAAHQSMLVQKTTFEGCLERISNSGGKKHPLSESFEQELDAGTQKDGSEKLVSVNNTPVRGRRSIHDSDSTSDDTPKMKAKLEDLAKMRESFVAKDSPKSAKKSPAAVVTPVRTPKSAKKSAQADESDELLKLMEDFVDETVEAVQTPKSSQKLANGTPAHDKTPKSAKKASKTGESDELLPMTEDTAAETVVTPKSAKKLPNGTPGRVKTPKSEKKAAETPGKSPRYSSVPMDISPDGQLDATVHESESMETEGNDEGEARDMEVTLNKSASSQKAPTPKSEKKYSIFQHVEENAKSSKRLSVVSLPNCASDKEESDDEDANQLRRKSWAVSVTRPATQAIDTAAKSKSPVVVKGQDQRVKGYSSDEDEGDEEESKNSFLDDEAEVGDEESITESEANYIREHELPDDGESIGSEDTDLEDELDEEEEGSSFLASDDEGIDQYSMNSSEEELEELEEKPKRKSRIIQPSSSEDEEAEVEKSPAKAAKSPAKSPKSASKKIAPEVEVEDEPEVEDELQTEKSPAKPSRKSKEAVVEPEEAEQVEERVSKKMKRRRESDLNGSVTVKPKRARMSDTSVVETPENTTGIAELFEKGTEEQQPSKKKAKKPKQPEAVDLEKVTTKVEDYMSKYTAEKKANMALKREKKAQKQALKLKEAEEAAKLAADGLDSSNNSNKENALAPKKKYNKSKIKKQKLVAEMPEEKESLAETVSKAQEKLERKRQRKLEKKLAKQQQQQSAESETAKEVEEAPVPMKKSKKPAKPVEPEVATEPVVEKKKSKKNKVAESPEEPAPVEPSKKKKKQKELVAEVEQPAPVPEKKKKKKVVAEEPALEPVLKTKKRKLDDSVDESAVQPKKKLNVLQQIENPFQYQPQARTSRNDNQDQLSIPLMSQKLKKVIPQKVEIEKKLKKKKAPGVKKSIPEPRKSLPRPVFTTAGIFIEAPISPFKFESTTYVPIAKTASLPTSYGVVAFEAKKKKLAQQQQPPLDFKTQQMFRNTKARDGSSKNMAGLVRKQHSL